MKSEFVNIHTHRPTHRGIELRQAGIHPWHAEEYAAGQLPILDERTEAIGEIGLDFRCSVPREVQFEVFRRQLELAQRLDMAVVLHCVKAFQPTLQCLHQTPPRAVIFHGFIGSRQEALEALRRGYYLSFGERTFRSPKTIEALRSMPLDHVFFETDDSPTPIEEIYTRMAELLSTSIEHLQRITTENYLRIFDSSAPQIAESIPINK